MHFPQRLAMLPKQNGLTQQAIADLVGLHVNQIKKYEAGAAQPTLKALVNLAKALHVSLDDLVFDEDERGPSDDFRLQFEAIASMPEEDRRAIKALLNSMIVKNRTRHVMDGVES